jgi:hypothetical protein
MADSNDGRLRIHSNSFQAGTSVDPKLAVASGYYYSQGLDNRTKPSQLSVLPAPRTISSTLTGLITAMDQDLNGVRWGSATDGGIYAINTSNAISKRAQMTEAGSAGILYNQVTDQLYIPGQTMVSMYGQVTTGIAGNPTLRSNQFAQNASTANGCVNLFNPSDGFFDGYARNNSQSLAVGITEAVVQSGAVITNTSNTYAVPSTLSELPDQFCYFAPDIEPFYSIMVYIPTPGTGNWTLTLHDSLNNQLVQVTLTNAQVIASVALNNNYVEFAFGSQIRALVNASQTGSSATYHWHITSTVSGGMVGTINDGDLSSADFLLFAYRLVQTKNTWHPTALFTGSGQPLLCIGNGQYLSTYNFGNDANPTNSQWQRSNLTFKQGYEVCGLTTYQQYLVIAVERRSANANRNQQDGALYLWDGTTNAPSIFIDITMGSPYGIYNHNGVVYFSCDGSLFAYAGGQTVIKVRKQAFYQNTDYLGAVDSTVVNPNMMCSRYNLLEVGFPSSSTNTQINYGVYSWGTVELTFPNSYGLSYTLANGYLNNNTSGVTNLQIGSVYNFVDSMYISWSYTLSGQTYYGVDLLDNFSTSAPFYSYQSLIWDGGVSYKIKKPMRVKVTCRALPAGQTLQAGYSLDGGAWQWSPSVTTGAVGVTIDANIRAHEVQYGLQGTTTGITNPSPIIGVTMDVNPLTNELNDLIASQ